MLWPDGVSFHDHLRSPFRGNLARGEAPKSNVIPNTHPLFTALGVGILRQQHKRKKTLCIAFLARVVAFEFFTCRWDKTSLSQAPWDKFMPPSAPTSAGFPTTG